MNLNARLNFGAVLAASVRTQLFGGVRMDSVAGAQAFGSGAMAGAKIESDRETAVDSEGNALLLCGIHPMLDDFVCGP